ncbi:cysteine peptidase family C39 domain-containing protein, partial [Aquabacterium sp. UBA2148]|uniref:cysteine peptidase family C39 domain-containing protein n=1 Tax=Aquabacterium sp. UBA2148 TaxID=1946042 RepID=UPI00257E8C2A
MNAPQDTPLAATPNTNAAPVATPAQPPTQPATEAQDAPTRLREDLLKADPLLDCLIEVCRVHGLPASRAALSAGLPLNQEALPVSLLERAAARAGLATKLQRCDLASIDEATLPAILLLKGDQACVLLGTEQDQARVLMPETGQGAVRLPLSELNQRHTGVVAFVRPHFRFDERTPATRKTR